MFRLFRKDQKLKYYSSDRIVEFMVKQESGSINRSGVGFISKLNYNSANRMLPSRQKVSESFESFYLGAKHLRTAVADINEERTIVIADLHLLLDQLLTANEDVIRKYGLSEEEIIEKTEKNEAIKRLEFAVSTDGGEKCDKGKMICTYE